MPIPETDHLENTDPENHLEINTSENLNMARKELEPNGPRKNLQSINQFQPQLRAMGHQQPKLDKRQSENMSCPDDQPGKNPAGTQLDDQHYILFRCVRKRMNKIEITF